MSGQHDDHSADTSKLLAYLQLFRAPNVFTALADVAMGFVFVAGSLEPLGGFLCLAAASCLLYTAGMILNDVYDFDIDLKQRPFRPLPSGRISRAWARALGYGMLGGGVVLASCSSWFVSLPQPLVWRSGAVALLLALCVVGYDKVFKQTPLGPLVMGACRFFNVLLGMSIAAAGDLTPLAFDAHHMIVAGGIGVYIVGVTWFARTEASESSRVLLTLGVALMAAGIMMLAFFPRYAPAELAVRFRRMEPTFVWPMAIFLLSVTILRRCLVAVAKASPQQVQAAVKQCILSLIVLDASVALLMADWPYAVGILALLVPMLLLGKWVYST